MIFVWKANFAQTSKPCLNYIEHNEHNDLPFMPESMKINKVEKLTPNFYDKKNYVIHIAALNQALKHGLILEKVHRVWSKWMVKTWELQLKMTLKKTFLN